VAKIFLTFPNEMLEEVDIAAGKEHRTRSEFIRQALREYMKSNGYSLMASNQFRHQLRRGDDR